ncbi:hypothetical protein [Novosphingobium sp. CECT 9465]|uniref:hypothetical protein n=1 Tax=Novosphingobium sp. CECT 9465 TaxID=2829794 RepID=UPI001E2A223C|nr:hypothetical protein [Novosphingobium sp. CECT 9465]
MLSHLPSRLTGRLWAALLALTVLFHATAPFDAPLLARSGSAFSAATVELAVAPERRMAPQRALLPIAPPGAVEILPPPVPVIPARSHAWPRQTAPPVQPPLLLRPAPTGPPHA